MYIDRMLSGIVGLEFEVLRWQGKWKVSQNQPEANQHSLVNRLLSDGSDEPERWQASSLGLAAPSRNRDSIEETNTPFRSIREKKGATKMSVG